MEVVDLAEEALLLHHLQLNDSTLIFRRPEILLLPNLSPSMFLCIIFAT